MKEIKVVIVKIIEFIIYRVSQLLISIYKIKNRKKSKILIFTDSRGHEITSIFNKKNPFSSYCNNLIKSYNTTVFICPEKHTTIIDFLHKYSKITGKFDLVILHCGVVDFSRRPISQLNEIYSIKYEKMSELGFTESDIKGNLEQVTGHTYNGEPTASIYTKQQFETLIIPALKVIDNLVFIGCNQVDLNWKGTYWQNRPEDINIILDYCKIAEHQLDNVLDLSTWSLSEVKLRTSDNIHPNKEGFRCINTLLKPYLPK